jgi:hypothetical protein
MRLTPLSQETRSRVSNDTKETRKAAGRCKRCAVRPVKRGGGTHCALCLAFRRTQLARADQRRRETALRVQGEIERRKLCREVVIDGTTFIVVNSVVTPSTTGYMKRAADPFLRFTRR